MIGNIDYIIDIVAEREGYDKEVLRGITMGYFKEWKKRMRYGEEIVIPFGKIGKFMVMNSKLRGFARRTLRKIRNIRYKRITGKSKMSANQLAAIEHKYMEEFRLAWGQMEVIRKIFIDKKKQFITDEDREFIEDSSEDYN